MSDTKASTVAESTPAYVTKEAAAQMSHEDVTEYCTSLFKRLGVTDLPVDKFLEKASQGRDSDTLLEVMQVAEEQGDCPICAAYRDPVTGEERFNAETVAAIEEGRAMMRGEIPAKRFKSVAEMFEDLDRDDPEDMND